MGALHAFYAIVAIGKSTTCLFSMRPVASEQARGDAVDKRADIWAFGVVLYELLTGKPLFGGGGSIADSLAAVLTREPDFGALPAGTPSRVRYLLEVSLRKDPRQRLRDIGDVRLLLDQPEPEAPRPGGGRWLWGPAIAALAIVGALMWYGRLPDRTTGPFQRVQITKLTDSGKASAAAISPDGKYVLHAVTDEAKSSLWLLHAATGSNVQILPPAQGALSNLNFSRDGNSLYYVFDDGKSTPTMYTMPVLGGNARPVAAFGDRSTWGVPGDTSTLATATLSQDEKRLAFRRVAGSDHSLVLMNLDGSGERQLAARRNGDYLGRAVWSPDGKTVAYVYGSSRGGLFSGLAAVPAEGGPEKLIGSPEWFFVQALFWMPDGRGLMAAANAQFPTYQLWYVPYPGGQARSITNDLNSYRGLSFTGDGSALVTVQNETTSHVWMVALDKQGNARQISTGRLDGLGGLAWAPDGKIYFEAPDSSKQDTQIWIMEPNGSGRKQITTGKLNGKPALCGDGKHLLFQSFRAGSPHIWRSDLNGGNLRQLTGGDEEWAPSCSPDGSWMTYESRGIWRMPVDGGAPVRIWNQRGWAWISPDGKSVLIGVAGEKLRIIPAAGGEPIKTFDDLAGNAGSVHWSADGSGLVYVKTVAGVSNLWQRPLAGGEPKQLTSFTSERITWFDVSRDGRIAFARGSTSSDVVLIRDLK
jgi:Tol biopolymer transport system component